MQYGTHRNRLERISFFTAEASSLLDQTGLAVAVFLGCKIITVLPAFFKVFARQYARYGAPCRCSVMSNGVIIKMFMGRLYKKC